MRVLLLQLDGTIPNLALMRIAAHHKKLGDVAELRRCAGLPAVERQLWDDFDQVYASAIFLKSKPIADRVKEVWPGAIVGGTGVGLENKLEDHGIETLDQDYEIYPKYQHSIGFSQRGCRLKCSFCVVPKKEGAISTEKSIAEIWRGDPYPRNIMLLDNDFFGQPHWKDRIDELKDGGFRVAFSQGINIRFLDEETAAAIASVDYRANDFKSRRIYTAWDNKKDEKRLFRGLEALKAAGVKPDHIMVYMLIGYWPGESHADREHRRQALRDWGAIPYPMAYERTSELLGFQRWVISSADKRISWRDFKNSRFQLRNLPDYEGRQGVLPVLN